VSASSNNLAASPAAEARRFSREAFLFASLVLLVLAIAFTAFVTRMYHKQVHTLADSWFAKGEASYRTGDAAAALADYRNALVFSPNNPQFQFHLAQALAATGHEDEARSYLLNLLSESPGSSEINLELARIAARQNSMTEALRYYHGAIYGVWDADPIEMRWKIRRELSEYLLDHDSANQAVAEIILLAENTAPGDIEHMKIAGSLLSRAQIWPRALAVFRSILAANESDDDALAGAAIAAFQLGQYSRATQYFSRLSQEKAADSKISELAETSRRLVAADPFVSGLPADEKARRTTSAVSIAQTRLRACADARRISLTDSANASPLQKAFATSQTMQKNWTQRNFMLHPDRTDAAMGQVFTIESLAAQECGPAQGDDRALWLLGRSRGAIP
jgi:tetratricopeptide (TPR) repeat protein